MASKASFENLFIDCVDSTNMQNFYAQLTGWEQSVIYGEPALVSDRGVNIIFLTADFDYVSPTWPEKVGSQQKQMHFDLKVEDIEEAVKIAIQYGGTKSEHQFGKEWVTLLDPEGHPFDVYEE